MIKITNEKIRRSIYRNLEKIVNKQFEERDIKELLIDTRESLKNHSISKEIAHFIAHSDVRNYGICHADLDYHYIQIQRELSEASFFFHIIPDVVFEKVLLHSV